VTSSSRFNLDAVPNLSAADMCFAHVCDTHVTDPASARILSDAVPVLNELRPDFVVFGGDLANHGDPGSYSAMQDALRGLEPPAHFIIGNHDFLGGKDTFERHLGPLNFAFDAGGYHVIGLDSTGRTSLTWEGLFTARAIAWLEDHLRAVPADQPLVLFTHHGIWSEGAHAPKSNLLWDVLNWKPIHAALEPFNLILACAGHAHDNARQRWGNATMLWSGVLSTVRQNHAELPVGFRLVWLRGSDVGSVWVPAEV